MEIKEILSYLLGWAVIILGISAVVLKRRRDRERADAETQYWIDYEAQQIAKETAKILKEQETTNQKENKSNNNTPTTPNPS